MRQKRARMKWECSAVLAIALAVACSSCGSQAAAPPPIPMPTGSVTDIEGNVYPTIKIGQQEWMVENLKTTTYNDGTSIPDVTDDTAWANLTYGAYSWIGNDVANKDVFGALYNWWAVDSTKLCPTGWSMPSTDTWSPLVTAEGGTLKAGGRMKDVGTTLWQAPNTGATNASGFSARPAGARDLTGSFVYEGQFAIWWCSDEDPLTLPATAGFMHLAATDALAQTGQSQLPFGYSVRCLR
jgi:uncharacterized protein (TIGR02145 family)